MTEKRLRWQKIAGFALPMLLAWFSLAWMWGVSRWLLQNLKNEWVGLLVFLSCLAYVPLVSILMGILSAHCWQHQQWTPRIRKDMIETFSILFWIFSLPLTIALVCSCFGTIAILMQVVFYNHGIHYGEVWIYKGVIDKFIGRKNDWERDETE